MNSVENKPQMKIFCFECNQKLDVTEFKSFTSFPCPVCESDIVVPKKLGDLYLIEHLQDDSEFENYIGLKEDKKVSVKVFKKTFKENSDIAGCLKILSTEHVNYDFFESNNQLIGICENLESLLPKKTAKKKS
ncbi:MAG: hypothetical protein NE330_15745 [Lentisphaeraceae bacterium]|nr:hypothetical protein [Lentisphaeraceae bacterium]